MKDLNPESKPAPLGPAVGNRETNRNRYVPKTHAPAPTTPFIVDKDGKVRTNIPKNEEAS